MYIDLQLVLLGHTLYLSCLDFWNDVGIDSGQTESLECCMTKGCPAANNF